MFRTALLALSFFFSGLAHAQAFDVDLPAQPLSAALAALSRQTGTQVLAAGDLVAGRTSPAVSGRLTASEALARLLAGSGLEAAPGGGGFVLRRAAPVARGEQQLPEVRVRGTGESAYGPVPGYVATRSATATKTDTALVETPRSLSVVGAEQIADQHVADVGAALRYTPGVYSEFRGMDTTRPNLVMRGFRDNNPLFLDGLRGFPTNFNSLSPELYGLERLEVLRGPAGMQYGAGSPGGLVNAISKRPTPEFFGEIEAGMGSFGQREARFDFGGRLGSGNVLYRLTGLHREGETQTDHIDNRRTYLAPAFTLSPGAGTSFTVLAQFQRDGGREIQFIPAHGTVLPNPNGSIPTRRFIGEPDYGGYHKLGSSLGYVLEHRLSGDLELRHSARYEHRKIDYRNVGGLGLQADLRTLTRSVFHVSDEIDSWTTDTNVQWKLGSGAVRHTVLAGVDYKRAKSADWQAFDFGTPLDIFEPVYGAPQPVPVPYQDARQGSSQIGLYAQDQIRLHERWLLTAGARRDRTEMRTQESFAATDTTDKHGATTLQGGVSYRFDSGLAPYASYAESFEAVAGLSSSGTPFVPVTGKQYEAGLKYQPGGTQNLFTASLFELTQQNVLTFDPADPLGGSTQTGEVRSRGLEAEARIGFARHYALVGGYSYTDMQVTSSNDGDLGKRPSRVPEHLASLWLNYTPPAGFGWGVGVRYVGPSYGDFLNTFEVPAYTLLDAALRYDFREGALRGVRVALNVSNLADKTYVASCEADGFCVFGLRRVVSATARMRF